MRHFPRLNRVASGILGRQHSRVPTLLEQNDRVRLRPYRGSAETQPPCVDAHLLRVCPFIIARRHTYEGVGAWRGWVWVARPA